MTTKNTESGLVYGPTQTVTSPEVGCLQFSEGYDAPAINGLQTELYKQKFEPKLLIIDGPKLSAAGLAEMVKISEQMVMRIQSGGELPDFV